MNLLFVVSIKGIVGILLLISLMFLATRKLFTKGWRKMKNEERMLSIIALLFLTIALVIVCILMIT